MRRYFEIKLAGKERNLTFTFRCPKSFWEGFYYDSDNVAWELGLGLIGIDVFKRYTIFWTPLCTFEIRIKDRRKNDYGGST
jgi:hypothetical protein